VVVVHAEAAEAVEGLLAVGDGAGLGGGQEGVGVVAGLAADEVEF
jgi:hypothetical protein